MKDTIKLYTYEEWKGIRLSKKKMAMEQAAYYMRQKLLGISMLMCSLVMMILDIKFDLDGVGGAVAVFIVPIAIYIMFTKKMVLTDSYMLMMSEYDRD